MGARSYIAKASVLCSGTQLDREKVGGLRDRTLQRHLKLLIQRGFVCDAKTGATDPTNYYEPVLSQPITSQLVHSTYV